MGLELLGLCWCPGAVFKLVVIWIIGELRLV
jgi:hypothetical protein